MGCDAHKSSNDPKPLKMRCCSILHPPLPRYRPAGQVGRRKRRTHTKTFGVNNRCAVKLLSLLPLLSRLEVLVCELAVCVEDLTSCRGWFIIVCLVRGLQAQPISCFMSFVYGFGLILSEKQEWALSVCFGNLLLLLQVCF